MATDGRSVFMETEIIAPSCYHSNSLLFVTIDTGRRVGLVDAEALHQVVTIVTVCCLLP